MKIVSVMTGAAPGGAEFAAVELLDGLISRGNEAIMLSDRAEIGRGTRVDVRPLDLGPKLSTRSYRDIFVRFPQLSWRLRKALEAVAPYDVLLVHYKKEQLLAPTLPRKLRPRLIWAEWGPVPFPMRSGIGNLAYRRSSRSADHVLAISEGTRRSVIEAGVDPTKVTVLLNALRTEEISFSPAGRSRVREELGIPADAFVTGCISRFHPKKRNDVVIDAVAELDDNAHLILAGAGETEDELRSRAASLGDRAHFISTPGGDVADVLSSFDVDVFCPSPTEGMPRAVILGMLAERPCVSTGAEGVADLIESEFGVILEKENDAGALAAVLSAYRDDPERRGREGQAARRRAVERFDMATISRQAERLMHGK